MIATFSAQPVAVFPTPVGVFPSIATIKARVLSLPHARGGVSIYWIDSAKSSVSSPRPWGCFSAVDSLKCAAEVFPTPVGVFLKNYVDFENYVGLPHARGGVSQHVPVRSSIVMVFPTPVGVFPEFPRRFLAIISLPHARGGVSR